MSKKSEETASFMVRFTQKIYEDNGEANVQWRGKISHVQGGDQKSFSDFDKAMAFMQEKLAELTREATQDKSPEEQDGILNKSFDIWKKMTKVGPKMIIDTIKDPKKQVAHLQDQIQDQISQVSDEISAKVEINQWRAASKSDFNKLMDTIGALSKEVKSLNEKVDKLSK